MKDILVILGAGIVIILLVIGIVKLTEQDIACSKYCKAKEFNSYDSGRNACFKFVPDESGIGTNKIYSGTLEWSECGGD